MKKNPILRPGNGRRRMRKFSRSSISVRPVSFLKFKSGLRRAGRLILPWYPKTEKIALFWTAIELGFHSLVEVLLEGGAQIEEPQNSLLGLALEKRRLDLIELLVKYGADAKSFPMEWVLGKGIEK